MLRFRDAVPYSNFSHICYLILFFHVVSGYIIIRSLDFLSLGFWVSVFGSRFLSLGFWVSVILSRFLGLGFLRLGYQRTRYIYTYNCMYVRYIYTIQTLHLMSTTAEARHPPNCRGLKLKTYLLESSNNFASPYTYKYYKPCILVLSWILTFTVRSNGRNSLELFF